MKTLKASLDRFKLVALLEGVSLLILVFIGVPLKHLLEAPLIVKIVGPIHGVLFLLYVLLAIRIGIKYRWKLLTWILVLGASLIPFGTFYVNEKMLSE